MIRGRNSMYDASCNPFSLITANITHDGNGSKQVDPRLSLYKRRRFHSHKESLNHSLYILSLCFREKIDLTVGGSSVGSHRSPLTMLSFFSSLPSNLKPIEARSIQPIDFLCIINWHRLWGRKSVLCNYLSVTKGCMVQTRSPLVQATKRVETLPATPIVLNSLHLLCNRLLSN